MRLNSAIAGFETGNLWYSNWAVSLKGGVTANENDGACGNGCARQICGAYLTFSAQVSNSVHLSSNARLSKGVCVSPKHCGPPRPMINGCKPAI